MTERKKPSATAGKSEPIQRQVVLDNPLGVTASYATMISVMSTDTAVRISFGEASPSGNRFHTAVAIDFETASRLRDELVSIIEKFESGEIEPMSGNIIHG